MRLTVKLCTICCVMPLIGCSDSVLVSYKPEISLSPATLDFGNAQVGHSAVLSLKISNAGTADASISGAAVDPSDSPFTIDSSVLPLVVAPEKRGDLIVTFSPQSCESFKATLQLDTNDSSQEPGMVALMGTGVGCDSATPTPVGTKDVDQDGYSPEVDCDDTNPSVNPGMVEICDRVDNDCDKLTDEDVLITYYADGDKDGFGQGTSTTQACSPPTGYSAKAGDCDDSNGAVNPSEAEVCNALDDDCDGKISACYDASLLDGSWWN